MFIYIHKALLLTTSMNPVNARSSAYSNTKSFKNYRRTL